MTEKLLITKTNFKMSSTSETGHAKNIANQFALNEISNGLGVGYAPSNPLLELSTMQAQYTDCNTKQGSVNTQNGIFKPLVNARRDEFKDVKPLVRRVRSSAKSCGAGSGFVANVNTLVMKILGERMTKAKPTPTDPAGTSASQQSFDNITNNFQALIGVLENEPMYNPNENLLKVVNLNAKYTLLNNKNNAVKSGKNNYNLAIIARNKALYKDTIGLVDVCQDSKEYIRGAFGYSSPEFKLVSKLKFVKFIKID